MISIEFNYEQDIVVIQANENDIFNQVINKYLQKSKLNSTSIYFLVNGNKVNPEETVESHMTQVNKETKKLNIIVTLIDNKTKLDVIIKSKDIICPKCGEPCKIEFKNFRIKLYACANDHTTDNIKIDDFQKTQNINISNIICGECKIKNMGNSHNNEFYLCLTCGNNICLLCKSKHNLNHNLIKYDEKNYICQCHNEMFVKFCKSCKKNLCFSCLDEHNEHETIFFGDIMPKMGEIKNKLSEMKDIIESFKDTITKIK